MDGRLGTRRVRRIGRLATTVAATVGLILGIAPAPAHADTSVPMGTYYIEWAGTDKATGEWFLTAVASVYFNSTATIQELQLPDSFVITMPVAEALAISKPGSLFDGTRPGDCLSDAGAGTGQWDRLASFQRAYAAYDYKTDPFSAYNQAAASGANAFWSAKPTAFVGQNVDVAVIDTGVAPVGDLADPSVVIHGPDFSFASQLSNLTHNDQFGHGTHMAEIVHQVAPKARILDIKVGSITGAVDVTQVSAAVDWVNQHAHDNGLNVRTILLSYGTTSGNTRTTDELSRSVDQAWLNNISVVAAAGNADGPDSNMGVMTPAFNTNVLAVGAYNAYAGYGAPGNPAMPTPSATAPMPQNYKMGAEVAFSAQQSQSNTRYPDIAAPGDHVASYRVPKSGADGLVEDELCNQDWSKDFPGQGSPTSYPEQDPSQNYKTTWYATQYPITQDAQGNTYVRASGTSQSAAIVAGATALMYSRWPTMTNDSLKRTLKTDTSSIPWGQRGYIGDGALNLATIFADSPNLGATQSHTYVSGGGSIELGRGGGHPMDTSNTAFQSTPSWCTTAPQPNGYVYQYSAAIKDGIYNNPPDSTVGNPLGIALCGEQDIFGQPYSAAVHDMFNVKPFRLVHMVNGAPSSGCGYYFSGLSCDAEQWLTTTKGSDFWGPALVAVGAPTSTQLPGWTKPLTGFQQDTSCDGQPATANCKSLGLVWPSITWSGNDWNGQPWATAVQSTIMFTADGWSANWSSSSWRDVDFESSSWRSSSWRSSSWRSSSWRASSWRGGSWRLASMQ